MKKKTKEKESKKIMMNTFVKILKHVLGSIFIELQKKNLKKKKCFVVYFL